jgi:beta-lactamase class A
VLPVVALVAGLLVFLASVNEEPVSRAQTPTVQPSPDPPAAAEARREDGGSNEGSDEGTDRAPQNSGISGGEVGDLRDELEGIAQAYPGRYGVIVSDPSSGETVSMDPDGRFLAASINKLPVLMALYRSAAAGTVDLDDEISMRASDIQAYGTGSLYTKPVGYTLTLRECAGFLIKESDNTAWKMLDRYLGRDYIRSELYSVGARETEYWLPNTTTPNDVMTMLEKISDPSYTTPGLSREMLDLMTNTDFEDRLPQPLPEDARVSHKIGSYGATFGDAGLVFPEGSRGPEDAYFIVVLVDETGESTARAAMQEMSLASYRAFTKADS